MENIMKRYSPLILLLTTVLILLSACGNQTSTPDTASADAIYTQAAGTVGAKLTQTAAMIVEPSSTPTSIPMDTQSVTETPLVTNTPLATFTQVVPTLGACDNMEYVSDVTIEDGSIVSAGSSFVKTWRVKNTGECSWTTAYRLVYGWASDNWTTIKTTPPAAVYLAATVDPGQEVEISVTLTAPVEGGTYQSSFRLQNANGYNFGTILYLLFEVEGTASPTP